MGFDKSKLMNNISLRIKEQGKKIGEVEDAIGVSRGYLSRMSKQDNETVPGVDLVCRLADELEVSIDTLIYSDFAHTNDNLNYIISFIQQLKEDTDYHKIDWSLENIQEIVEDTESKHRLIETYVLTKVGDDGKSEEVHTYKYESPFLPDENVVIHGNCYYGWADNLGDIYLMNLAASFDGKPFYFFELITAISDNEPLIPICSTLLNEGVKEAVLNLYNCIADHDQDMKVSLKAKSVIDRYMQSHNDLPFN